MLALCLLVCLGLALAAEENGICSAADQTGCAASAASVPYVPFKGTDLNRSGFSPHVAPFDITRPSWLFEEPDRDLKRGCVGPMAVFHSSPVIDAALNVYIQSTTGWVYSVDKAGKLRWSYQLSNCNPGNIALLDGVVYTIAQDGVLFALRAATGELVWKRSVALGAPDDTHSLIAVGETVLTACNPVGYGTVHHPISDGAGNLFTSRPTTFGNENVCAFDAKDGSLRWTYSMYERSANISYNQMQAVVGDTVVFSDTMGGSYRVRLQDGKELWHSPGVSNLLTEFLMLGGMGMGSTGNMVVGPNDKMYLGFNIRARVGMLRAVSLHDGAEAWRVTFHEEVNSAPAVGRVFGHEKLAVVAVVGNNCDCQPLGNALKLKRMFGFSTGHEKNAAVVALDAENGRRLWTFDLPFYNDACAGMTWTDTCCPDMFGNPAIGGDGTVYVNWSGGKHYALRDANGDGKVSEASPGEISSYHSGFASNGITAIAPGLAVFPNCRYLVGYT